MAFRPDGAAPHPRHRAVGSPPQAVRCAATRRRWRRRVPPRLLRAAAAPAPAATSFSRGCRTMFHVEHCPTATRGSVSRVLSGGSRPVDGHSSTTGVAAGLQQPTRTTGPVPALPCRHGAPSLFGLAPGGVYLAARRYRQRGALLPHPFSLAGANPGGLLSVALSLGSPPPGVTRHRRPVEPGLSSPARLRRRPSNPLAGAGSRRSRAACQAAGAARALPSYHPRFRGRRWERESDECARCWRCR